MSKKDNRDEIITQKEFIKIIYKKIKKELKNKANVKIESNNKINELRDYISNRKQNICLSSLPNVVKFEVIKIENDILQIIEDKK